MLWCPDKTKNLATAVKEIHKAKQRGAQLVALPECYKYEHNIDWEEVPSGEACRALSEAAAEAGVCVVGGTLPERDGSALYNTCTVWDSDGSLLARHRKMHLYDIDIPNKVTHRESELVSAGDQITTFVFNGVKIGLGICFDICFPEMVELMAQDGCSLLIFPSDFHMVTGSRYWEALGRTRAFENQLWVALVGPARDPDTEYKSWGHSMLVDPWGTIKAELDENVGTILEDIDFNVVEEVRKQWPVRAQRRTDVYNTVRKSS
ncbi:omega-amidase NIT2-like isoform X2 [Ostrinia furnacalis]|nr:omega-amidase NIT2-like isoform X2 [Ostrinia furnacalis]